MFKNIQELITSMPDEASCRAHLESQRWNGKPICPYCNNDKAYKLKDMKTYKGMYKCANKSCYKKFSVTMGTIFEDSKIPLNKWFIAVYLNTAHKKGVSSCQLAKNIGVSQRTAWFMLHRIREGVKPKEDVMLDKIVEVDESWAGGKIKNKHKSIRDHAHKNNLNHIDGRTGFVGYLQREGELKLKVWDLNKPLRDQVKENVKPEAVLITDGYPAYVGLDKHFEAHETVNHKKDEYVRGQIHTNSIEGAFSHFKRMVVGTYHSLSPKHLQAYCNEFTFRFNSRKMKDADRFNITLQNCSGRLTYKDLTAKV